MAAACVDIDERAATNVTDVGAAIGAGAAATGDGDSGPASHAAGGARDWRCGAWWPPLPPVVDAWWFDDDDDDDVWLLDDDDDDDTDADGAPDWWRNFSYLLQTTVTDPTSG